MSFRSSLTEMSEISSREVDTMLGQTKKKEISSKETVVQPYPENANGNLEDCKSKESISIPPVNGVTTNQGSEISNLEVEYIESEKLKSIEDVDAELKTLLVKLDSKDWVVVCDALNTVRRLAIYHKEAMIDILGDVISLIVKSLKNPRSAVCKTAIMTSADIFNAYNDQIIELLHPMLLQLLLKSSQDKRFVCEAAERALIAMTTWFSPALLLPKLEQYLKNKNPRIRAKASICFCRSVPRLGVEGIRQHGIKGLVQIAAPQLSDQLPESREGARTLILELRTVYEKFPDHISSLPEEAMNVVSWEEFCQSILSPLNAQAVLRVSNTTREVLVSSS